MKTRLLVIGATALAVLVPTAASTAAPPGGDGGGPRDSAVGTAQSGDMRVAFAAHGSGPDVTGHFRAGGSVAGLGKDDPTEFQFEGPVTFLDVQGKKACLFYPVKQGKPETFEDTGIFIYLEDNGDPGDDDQPDRIGFTQIPFPDDDREPPACPQVPALDDIDKGDIKIREGTP